MQYSPEFKEKIINEMTQIDIERWEKGMTNV